MRNRESLEKGKNCLGEKKPKRNSSSILVLLSCKYPKGISYLEFVLLMQSFYKDGQKSKETHSAPPVELPEGKKS